MVAITASNTVQYSSDPETNLYGSSWIYTETNLKSITVIAPYTGSWRISFTIRGIDYEGYGTSYWRGRIYKNGVPYGADRVINAPPYSVGPVTYTEDFTGISINAGDTIQLLGGVQGGDAYVYVSNFRIMFDASPNTGNASFTSNPSGARIWVDGIDKGLNTPNTITGLSPGSHTYRLTLAGYQDATGSFNIISGSTITVPTITLTPLTGNASFTSNPSGARIWVDGIDKGLNTPNTITGLSPGSHSYTLKLIGYLDATGSFSVTGGSTTTVPTVNLTPASGDVSIISTPSVARIWIDGIDRGVNTPNIVTGLSPGSHTYRLVLIGYADATGPFSITAGVTTNLNVTFAGSLDISSVPSGAEVWIDNVDMLITTPATITNLTSGPHTYKLTIAGYNDVIGPFNITDGTTTTISETFTGNATFSSTPSGARIWLAPIGSPVIDQGVNTPNTITGLTQGNYDYKLTLSGYYDETGIFSISPGQTTVIPKVTMTLIVGALNISSTPSGAQIWLAPTGSPLVNQGVTTPAIIGDLTPGTPYTYELRLIDYYPKSGTFTLADGETITRSETLDILPCPTSLRYEGNTITLQAAPINGTGPYYIEFRKNGVAIPGNDPLGRPYIIPSAIEDIQLTRTYILTDEDIRNATLGTIDFEIYMEDSCPVPIGPKTCNEICTINIGCLAPVCNFSVT